MNTVILAFTMLILVISSNWAYAQEPSLNESTNSQTQIKQAPSTQDIVRLEDTIRANKEQPQVLTIVPWQLPLHQRINENKQWQQQVTELPLIERTAFLRNLALVNELNTTVAASQKAANKKSQ